MKILIMKVELCLSGQLSNLTKSKKKTIVAVLYGWWTDWGKENIRQSSYVNPKQTST